MAAPTIVVVDHDESYIRLMEVFLQTEGFSVKPLSGTISHREIAREAPDILMIDTWLSGRDDGMALLQMMKLDQKTKDIPILITSSDPDDLSERLQDLPGRNAFLRKPFATEKLLAALNSLLDTTAGK